MDVHDARFGLHLGLLYLLVNLVEDVEVVQQPPCIPPPFDLVPQSCFRQRLDYPLKTSLEDGSVLVSAVSLSSLHVAGFSEKLNVKSKLSSRSIMEGLSCPT